MTQSQMILIVLGVVLVVAVLLTVRGALARRRTRRLHTRFGAEYARAVGESGGRGKAEAGLEAREKRVDAMSVHDLTTEEADHFANAWRALQAEFVEDPAWTVTKADHLLSQVMSARGFPAGDFAQRSADLSVDHSLIIENYRNIHAIGERAGRGEASTEDMRQAMLLYRSLFVDLIGARGPEVEPSGAVKRSASA